MMRTSIVLPAALHRQLTFLAQQEGKRLSEFVREQLTHLVTREQDAQLDQMYDALRQMKGVVKDDASDASQTIDDVLYGEQGVHGGANRVR